jgi:hypothetical protein
MDFRWVAGITLWTMLSGPVFVGIQNIAAPSRARTTISAPVGKGIQSVSRPVARR